MADVAYTRKYRPKLMKDYLGEDLKKKIMTRMKDEKNFPQIVLAYGTRGTGKTTALRLLAKEYLCTDRQNGCACGKCDNCLEIDEDLIDAEFGASTMAVTEINVGTDGGKGDVEQMIEDMRQQPTYGYKYNIFILDECHMFTKGAQNALLKILEEPPKHLVIMLATTDPDKLLGTIRDRCQFRLQMKPATAADLVARMTYICQQEKITTSKEALNLIAKLCKKNPRDSLMTLENTAKNFDHVVTVETVMLERGAVATELYARYMNGANSNSPIEATLHFLNELEDKGITYKDFLAGFTEYVMDCVGIKYGIGIEDATDELAKEAQAIFKNYSIEDIDCLLQIVEYANKQVTSNENMGRLTILNTAMRISKVKLLAVGLQHVQKDTADQNSKAAREAVKVLNEEEQDKQIRAIQVDDATLASVFGRDVKEIAPGANIALVSDAIDTGEEEESVGMSDDAMLALFGYSGN